MSPFPPPFVSTRRRSVSAMLCVGAVAVLALVSLAPTASAYETGSGTSWTVSGNTAAQTSPSGLTTVITMTGESRVISATPIAVGLPPSAFTPSVASPAIPFVNLGVGMIAGGSCGGADGSHCPGLGQMIVDFSRPVTNPVLHFAGIGGGKIQGANVSRFTAQFDLVGTTGHLGSPSSGATNLAVVGPAIVADAHASSSCVTVADLGAGRPLGTSFAGCGSVPVIGTFTRLVFDLSENWAIVQGVGNNTFQSDSFNLGVTIDQDFADAPASYDGAQAPAHLVGDLALGARVDADNVTARSATVSPFPEAGTAVDDAGDNAAGADEDGLLAGTTIVAGHAFDLTIALSGASSSGEVCGFVDLGPDGVFDTGVERSCAGFVAGQTSVDLAWSVPRSTPAGPTYLRLRATYGAAGGPAASPTGLADSGEVEDHLVAVVHPGAVAGRVFVDGTNAPLVGVVLTLLDDSGTTVETAVTAADGSYSFDDLLPGAYRVVQSQPSGYESGAVAPSNEVTASVEPGVTSVGSDFSERQVAVVPPSTTSTVPTAAPTTSATTVAPTPVPAAPATTAAPAAAPAVGGTSTRPSHLALTGGAPASTILWGLGGLVAGSVVLRLRRAIRRP